MKKLPSGLIAFGKINKSLFPSQEERTQLYEMKTTGLTPSRAAEYTRALCCNTSQPTNIMMVGLPASGKSTFIGLFNGGPIQYPVVSTDAMFEEAAARAGMTYDQYAQGPRHALMLPGYLARAEDMIRHYINNNISFAIDQTLLTKEHRFSHLVKLIGRDYRKICILFEVNEKVRDARLKKRSIESGKTIPPDRLAAMRDSYVRPTREEGFDEIILIND